MNLTDVNRLFQCCWLSAFQFNPQKRNLFVEPVSLMAPCCCLFLLSVIVSTSEAAHPPLNLPVNSTHNSTLLSQTLIQAYPDISALKGTRVVIPCNISHHSLPTTSNASSITQPPSALHQQAFWPADLSPQGPDSAALILWYQGDDISGTPIYTVDMRDLSARRATTPPDNRATHNDSAFENGSGWLGRHFISAGLQNRSQVKIIPNYSAQLQIDNVNGSDAGTYWCRVDFRWKRTLISMVRVHIDVAPESVHLVWQSFRYSTPDDVDALRRRGRANCSSNQTHHWDRSRQANRQKLSSHHQLPQPLNKQLPYESGAPKPKSSSLNLRSESMKLEELTWHDPTASNQTHTIVVANEGEHLRLICVAIKGNPAPAVVWLDSAQRILDSTYSVRWMEIDSVPSAEQMTRVIDSNPDSFLVANHSPMWTTNISMDGHHYSQQEDEGRRGPLQVVINEMTLFYLQANISEANFTCLVNSTRFAPPIVRTVQLQLNLKPSHVTLLPPTGFYLSDELKTEVTCRAYGAKPFAVISWYLGEENITHLSDFVFELNYTQSVLRFTPNWTKDQQELHCMAYNPVIGCDAGQHDSILLDIRYVPRLKLFAFHETTTLKWLQHLTPEEFRRTPVDSEYIHITEHFGLTLACAIVAKPNFTVVRWSLNQEEIWQEKEGIVITGQMLTIVNAHRSSHEGAYRCMAFNSEGRGLSNELHVRVDHVPECTAGERPKVFYGSVGRPLAIRCEVNAKPNENLVFHWTLNSQPIKTFELDPKEEPKAESIASSTLRFTPKSSQDFGEVKCWAQNTAGSQVKPCVFQIRRDGRFGISSKKIVQPLTNRSGVQTESAKVKGQLDPNFSEHLVLADFDCFIYNSNSSIRVWCTLIESSKLWNQLKESLIENKKSRVMCRFLLSDSESQLHQVGQSEWMNIEWIIEKRKPFVLDYRMENLTSNWLYRIGLQTILERKVANESELVAVVSEANLPLPETEMQANWQLISADEFQIRTHSNPKFGSFYNQNSPFTEFNRAPSKIAIDSKNPNTLESSTWLRPIFVIFTVTWIICGLFTVCLLVCVIAKLKKRYTFSKPKENQTSEQPIAQTTDCELKLTGTEGYVTEGAPGDVSIIVYDVSKQPPLFMALEDGTQNELLLAQCTDPFTVQITQATHVTICD